MSHRQFFPHFSQVYFLIDLEAAVQKTENQITGTGLLNPNFKDFGKVVCLLRITHKFFVTMHTFIFH